MSTTYSPVVHPSFVDYKDDLATKDKTIKEEFHKNQAFRFRAEDPINCSALSSNAEYLVVGCHNSIVLYSLIKKERLQTKEEAHKKNVSAVAISHDNNYIASASVSGELALWQLNSMQRIRYQPEAHEGPITCLKFTSNGSHLISISLDGTINIWNVENDLSCEGFHTGTVDLRAVLITKDNKHFVIAGFQNIEIWDFASRKPIYTFKNAHKGMIWGLTLSQDERYLVSCSEEIKVWDFNTKDRIEVLTSNKHGIFTNVTLARNNTLLAAGTNSGKVVFWNLKTRKDIYCMERVHDDAITTLSFIDNDHSLLTCSRDRAVRVWNIDQESVYYHYNARHHSRISCAAVAHGSHFYVTGSYDSSIDIYSVEKHHPIGTLEGHEGAILQVLVSPNRNIISLSTDGTVKVWEYEGSTCIKTIKESARCMTLSNDGKTLITGGSRLCAWDLDSDSPEPLKKFSVSYEITDFVDCQVSQDGSRLVGINNKNIFVFDLSSGEEVVHFARAHEEDLRKVVITKDNEYIITAGQCIKIWSITKKECIATLENANNAEIIGLGLTGQGRFIVAGRRDETIEIWDRLNLRLVHVYKNPYSLSNTFVGVTPDQKYIFATGESANRDVVIFNNFFETEDPIVSLGLSSNIDMRTRLGIFVLDGFLDLRGRAHRAELIQNYPELVVYPYNWNLLHLSAIYFPDPKTIQACIDARVPITIDSEGLTPLHHLFKKDKVDFNIVNLVLEHFDKLIPSHDEYRMHQLMESLSNIVTKIIRINSPMAANLLKYFYGTPLTQKNAEIPTYGKLKRSFWSNQQWDISSTPYFTHELREKHLSYHPSPISVNMLKLKYNYDVTSEEMMKLTYALSNNDHEEVFKTPAIATLVDYIWQKNIGVHLLQFVLYSVALLLFSIWAGLDTRPENGLSIVAFIFGILFFFIELLQFTTFGVIDYCLNLWNIFDIIRNIWWIITFGYAWKNQDFADRDENTEQTRAWMVSLSILFGYIKWIKYFSFIKQTRRLLRLMIEAFKDLLSLILVIIFFLFGFAIIFRSFAPSFEWDDLVEYVFMSMFTPAYNWNMDRVGQFFFIIFSIFLCLFLLLILVSLIIHSNSKTLYQNIILDNKDKLRLALQCMVLRSNFNCLRRRSKFSEESSHYGYLFYIGTHSYEGNSLLNDDWDGEARALKKSFEVAGSTSASVITKQNVIESMEKEFGKQKDQFKKEIKTLVDANREIRTNLKIIAERLGIQLPAKGGHRPLESTILDEEERGKNLPPLQHARKPAHNYIAQKRLTEGDSFKQNIRTDGADDVSPHHVRSTSNSKRRQKTIISDDQHQSARDDKNNTPQEIEVKSKIPEEDPYIQFEKEAEFK